MVSLRKKYWIVRGGQFVSAILKKCVQCFRSRPHKHTQLLGNLPPARVQFSKAFLHTGVDFAGPIRLRISTGRGVRTTKGYVAIFICLSIKAVHFEVVSSLTTDAFIAALCRFRARRGTISHIYSDNGTNFVGAFRKLSNIDNQLARSGIEWSFNPPLAPHFGGLWEAGVKSMKNHLYKNFSGESFTFEEMSTVLCSIEMCMNARLLCPLSADIDSVDALTPQHFLTSDTLTEELDGRDFRETPIKYLSRWEKLKKAHQEVCFRYKNEYLSRMNQRPKNYSESRNFEVGQLVLLQDESSHCSSWPLGRIVITHPGKDGLVRVVSVQTRSGIKKRPIVKVYPLPIDRTPAATVLSQLSGGNGN